MVVGSVCGVGWFEIEGAAETGSLMVEAASVVASVVALAGTRGASVCPWEVGGRLPRGSFSSLARWL